MGTSSTQPCDVSSNPQICHTLHLVHSYLLCPREYLTGTWTSFGDNVQSFWNSCHRRGSVRHRHKQHLVTSSRRQPTSNLLWFQPRWSDGDSYKNNLIQHTKAPIRVRSNNVRTVMVGSLMTIPPT